METGDMLRSSLRADDAAGHKAGFLALTSMLKYCYELGIKCVSIYAFSIDNFKRRPNEVQYVMDLTLKKIQGLLKEKSIVQKVAAEKAMVATTNNTGMTMPFICVAYTSTDEIVHAIQESCNNNWVGIQEANGRKAWNQEIRDEEYQMEEKAIIKLRDIEKHMYMDVAPDPDILIQTSGEHRLSNFQLWQTTYCLLCSPAVLWPEIGIRHLVRAVLDFQQHRS
uniref:Alkyl transferase n=1 Tax=Quercus lobata TaxID=97700 RepID=A0A7N2KNF7_QUELO